MKNIKTFEELNEEVSESPLEYFTMKIKTADLSKFESGEEVTASAYRKSTYTQVVSYDLRITATTINNKKIKE